MIATSNYFQLEWAIQMYKKKERTIHVTREEPEFVAQESIPDLAESIPWNLFLDFLNVY